mmetsp:Transcript_10332/g.22956  ORF Transcript_10332/g.22956 Transcript_10332/m.22956 type:complete len:230 (+) Transcript_10332:98-787(+)
MQFLLIEGTFYSANSASTSSLVTSLTCSCSHPPPGLAPSSPPFAVAAAAHARKSFPSKSLVCTLRSLAIHVSSVSLGMAAIRSSRRVASCASGDRSTIRSLTSANASRSFSPKCSFANISSSRATMPFTVVSSSRIESSPSTRLSTGESCANPLTKGLWSSSVSSSRSHACAGGSFARKSTPREFPSLAISTTWSTALPRECRGSTDRFRSRYGSRSSGITWVASPSVT